MSGSSEPEQQARAEEGRKEKKHKSHKSKKEKKHKRHKEKRKSESRDEAFEDATTRQIKDTVNFVLPNGKGQVQRDESGADAVHSPVSDKADGSTPESGEIGDKPQAGADGQSLGRKRSAGRELDGDSFSKRLKIDSSPPLGAKESSKGEGDDKAAVNAVDVKEDSIWDPSRESSPKRGDKASSRIRRSQSPKEALTEGTQDADKGRRNSMDKDKEDSKTHTSSSQHRKAEKERQDRDKHRSRSRHADRNRHEHDSRRHRSRSRDRDRGLSRHRTSSRERGLDSRRHDWHHRHEGRHESRRPDSRSRHTDDQDRRDYDRSRRRDDSQSRRHGSSRRDREEREKDERKRKSKEKEDKEFAAKVIAKLEENEVDEDELIEQRRRKRQELMAKLQQEKESAEAVANPTASATANPTSSAMASPSAPQSSGPEMLDGQPITEPEISPTAATTAPEQATTDPLSPTHDKNGTPQRQEDPSNLSDSETEDEHGLDEGDEQQLFQTRKEGQASLTAPEGEGMTSPASSEERHKIANQEKKAATDEFDMFSADKVDDMFGDAPVGAPMPLQNAPKRGLLDNYDDSEGYYNFQVGEIMNDRYEVFATHGKGVFSTVLRARDRKPLDEKGNPVPVVGGTFPEVAIKVIRANDIMSKAGQTEVVILRKLAGADPTGKYHIIRLLRTFEYRNHLCLVFEPLESNLRQLTKKYGQGIGLRLDAVRSMAAQMLMALHLMKQCGVLHADIKPDNILINRGHNIVKMCDFGSAMFMGNNEITPYLVSRFYRAPEIILGLHYDHPMDVWSIGCVIYELFTGRILFPGRSNNEMLKLMMDVKGPFPKKMLKKGEFSLQHFEDDPAMSFCLMEMDPLTKRPTKRLVPNPTVKKDFRGHLAGQEGEAKQVGNLIDLLEKMMHLDPDKRITAKEALRHPFIKDGRTQRQ